MICMKKTLNIDEKLLAEAREATGARTDTEAVRLGLEAVIRSAAYQRMRSFLGSESYSKDVPRRREAPARSRRKRVA
jgi:Arc/MetJ family transcription regulator